MTTTFATSRSLHLSRVLFLVLSSSLLLTASYAQSFDCSCAPAEYTFVFDFSLTCADETISTKPGVASYTCSDDGGDITPFHVTSYHIVETSADSTEETFSKAVQPPPQDNGDSFVYESAMNFPSPRILGLKVNLTGTDSGGSVVENSWEVTFTRECSIFPVLSVGDVSGWLRITGTVDPSVDACAGVDPNAPTPTPTVPPTFEPTITASPATPPAPPPPQPQTSTAGTSEAKTTVPATALLLTLGTLLLFRTL